MLEPASRALLRGKTVQNHSDWREVGRNFLRNSRVLQPPFSRGTTFANAFGPNCAPVNSPEPLIDSLSVPIPFVKMHGIGNDFVVLDCLRHNFSNGFNFALFAEVACDRNFGIGGDGLLSLERATDGSDVRMRMWNPDGTEDMCGNGLRCVARLAFARGEVVEQFSVQTQSGRRRVHVLPSGLIRVSMGAPDFSPAHVPINRTEPLIEGAIELDGHHFEHVTSLSTGSTHTVVFLDAPVSETDFSRWSPLLEVAPMFPERTSIMWAHKLGNSRFGVRIWERGAGETLACGTGACAVAVAARTTGRALGSVEVVSKGGQLEIEWDEASGEIWKTGPAHIVFEGVWTRF